MPRGFKPLLILIALATVIIAAAASLSAAETPLPPFLDDIARATTVLISPDLSKEEFANGRVNPSAGSGVIIARENKSALPIYGKKDGTPPENPKVFRYFVLTNAHVVDDRVASYGIRTADGEVHPEGRDPLKIDPDDLENLSPAEIPPREIFRGKCFEDDESLTQCFGRNGPDLAVLTFWSDNFYPVAPLGDASRITVNEGVLVSGWPRLSFSTQRKRVSLEADIVDRLQPGEKPGNYTLVTEIQGKQGISGGPVFNANGQVIGIYGAGQAEGESIGSTDNYAVDIGQFFQMQSSPKYSTTFKDGAPVVAISTWSNLQDAVTFSQRNKAPGDNLTEEERKNFYISDLVPDDPRVKSIQYLNQELKCFPLLPGNRSGGGFKELRATYIRDLATCLDAFVQKQAEAAPAQELEAFRQKLPALAERISRLKNSPTGNQSPSGQLAQPPVSQTAQADSSIPSTTFLRARNLARQAAESANGGIGLYRSEPSMHDPRRRPDEISGNRVLTYRFRGGAPGYTTPSVETAVTVDIMTWTVTLQYNRLLR